MEKLLTVSLDSGLSEERFWDMSVAELRRHLEAWNRREKRLLQKEARETYTLASLIGAAVSRVLSGSDFPTLENVFPGLFEDEDKPVEKEPAMDPATAVSVARFMNFAIAFNKKKEAENNART